MYLTQSFTIGTSPGQYTPGSYIQDSIFKDSRIEYILVNNIPNSTDYIHNESVSRLEAGTLNNFSTGDIIIVHFYKY